MKKADVVYAELVKRLKSAFSKGQGRDRHEVETADVLAAFFSTCIAALELEKVVLAES